MNPHLPLPEVDQFAKDTSNTQPHSRRPVNCLPLKRILRRVRLNQQAKALSHPGNSTSVGSAWDVPERRIVDSASSALTNQSSVDPGSRSRNASSGGVNIIQESTEAPAVSGKKLSNVKIVVKNTSPISSLTAT